jgi:hypothetical protein
MVVLAICLQVELEQLELCQHLQAVARVVARVI